MRCATLVRQFLALVEGVDHQDAGLGGDEGRKRAYCRKKD
jgi:hypothetical protein